MEIRSIIESDEVTEVHHGDCIGADASFHNIAKESRKRIVIHPPENDGFCNRDKKVNQWGVLAHSRPCEPDR